MHPDKVFVADWGVRVNHIDAKSFFWEEVEFQQRPEIEYEQDIRVAYNQEDVSLTQFWQGCESFIGKQELCESDESLSLKLTPDQLNDAVISQGGLISNSPSSVTSFSEPHEDEWQVNENPVLEEIYNISITEDDLEALGNFSQLGIRHAFRVSVDFNQGIDVFYFNEIQVPFYFQKTNGAIFAETKVILKTSYISNEYSEQAYMPNRSLLEENQRVSFCYENTCSFEYLSSDIIDVDTILGSYSASPENIDTCSENGLMVWGLSAIANPDIVETQKAIFHYEIQISIINTNNVDKFNPLDYLDRDLTLPPKEDAGSLCYLLLLGVLAFIRRNQAIKVQQ